jgi:hypothetical protein
MTKKHYKSLKLNVGTLAVIGQSGLVGVVVGKGRGYLRQRQVTQCWVIGQSAEQRRPLQQYTASASKNRGVEKSDCLSIQAFLLKDPLPVA